MILLAAEVFAIGVAFFILHAQVRILEEKPCPMSSPFSPLVLRTFQWLIHGCALPYDLLSGDLGFNMFGVVLKSAIM